MQKSEAFRWRDVIIQNLFACVHLVPKTLEPTSKLDDEGYEELMGNFLLPAHNPEDKGFRNRDIQYYLDGALVRAQQAINRKNFDLACRFRTLVGILREELDRREVERSQHIENKKQEREETEKKLTDEYTSWLAEAKAGVTK